jgi:hypothetical protein
MDPVYSDGPGAIFAMFGIGFFITMLAFAVFTIICQWKVYEKAGQPGWAVLVPIYNLLVLFKIMGKPWTWIFLVYTPAAIVGIFIVWISGSLALARNFGKSSGFAVGLMFLPIIFYAIIAFDKTIRYRGPNGDDETLDTQIESIGKPAF